VIAKEKGIGWVRKFILRVPLGIQQNVEVALVCQEGLRRLLHEDLKLKKRLKDQLRRRRCVCSIEVSAWQQA